MIDLSSVALLHPRGGSSLVSDATLAVGRGQVVLVAAAAGLGSSRLLAALLGEADCAAGTITVLGHDVGKLRRASLRKLRRRIGIVPQELCLLEDRSAQLNVVMPLEIDGVPRSASIGRATEVLDQLALTDEATLPVDVLSRSARQRVAVARALMRRPEVLLADHPTSDQDAAGAALVCLAIDQAAAAGAACLVFSRDPMLRMYAEEKGWGQWVLEGGQLRPLAQHESGESLEEILVTVDSSPYDLPGLAGGAVGAPLVSPMGSPLGTPSVPPLTHMMQIAQAAAELPPSAPLPFPRDATRGGVNGSALPSQRGRESPLSEEQLLDEDPFENLLPFPGPTRSARAR
jgi:ABC-type ATPase involved in cell division